MSNMDRFEKKYGAFPSLGYKLKKIFHVLFPLAWSPKRKKQTSFQGQKEKPVVLAMLRWPQLSFSIFIFLKTKSFSDISSEKRCQS